MAISDSVTSMISMTMFALATSITPGPVNVVSLASGARFGVLKSIPYVLGATFGFVAVLALLGSGTHSFIDHVRTYSEPMAMIGAMYMLYLSWKIGMDSGDVSSERTNACPGLLSGIVMQISNPKAWFVALSAITLHVFPSPDPVLKLLVFSLIFFLICFLSLMTWVVLGVQLNRSRLNTRTVNKVMAIVLAASVLLVFSGVGDMSR